MFPLIHSLFGKEVIPEPPVDPELPLLPCNDTSYTAFQYIMQGDTKPVEKEVVTLFNNTFNPNNFTSMRVAAFSSKRIAIHVPPGVSSVALGRIDVFGDGWTSISSLVYSCQGGTVEYTLQPPKGNIYLEATSYWKDLHGSILINNSRNTSLDFSHFEVLVTVEDPDVFWDWIQTSTYTHVNNGGSVVYNSCPV